MRKPKTYLDTSVISFYFADDSPEKKEITRRFIDQELKSGKYEIYISNLNID
jgi:predicted nucleic acid-binding protein